jgi:hypothetical protein
MIVEDAERREFEKWVIERSPPRSNADLLLETYDDGEYMTTIVRWAWAAWMERAKRIG